MDKMPIKCHHKNSDGNLTFCCPQKAVKVHHALIDPPPSVTTCGSGKWRTFKLHNELIVTYMFAQGCKCAPLPKCVMHCDCGDTCTQWKQWCSECHGEVAVGSVCGSSTCAHTPQPSPDDDDGAIGGIMNEDDDPEDEAVLQDGGDKEPSECANGQQEKPH